MLAPEGVEQGLRAIAGKPAMLQGRSPVRRSDTRAGASRRNPLAVLTYPALARQVAISSANEPDANAVRR